MRTWALGRLSNFVRKSVGTDTVSREYYSYDRERGVQPSVAMLSDTSRYATSDDIYAAVGLLADCAMQIPWTVLVDGEPAPGHDLDILLNNRPNPLYGGHDFWMRAYSTLWLTGEAWLVIERTNPVARSMPNELWLPRSDHMAVVPGSGDVVVDHYVYNPLGDTSKGERIEALDTIPACLWHPVDPLRGLSPISSLRLGLDADRQAMSANRDLFSNGMLIDGALSVEGPLGEEGRTRMRAELEKRHGGGGNRHRLMVLEAGKASYVPMRMTPRDAEFLEMQKLTTRDVAKVYRIPPMELGDLEHSTLANMEQGDRSLWEKGVMPKVRLMASALNVNLAWQFGEGVTVAPNTSGIASLREDLAMQADAMQKLCASGLSVAWAGRKVFGEEIPADDIVPRTTVALPGQQPAPPVGKGQPTAAGLTPLPAPPRSLAVWTTTTKALARADLYDRVNGQKVALESGFARGVHLAFQSQQQMILAAYDRFTGKAYADDLVTLLWSKEAASEMEQAIFAGVEHSALGAVQSAQAVFGLSVDENRIRPEVHTWAGTHSASQVQWVNETTRDALRSGIASAMSTGGGVDAVRLGIQQAFRQSDEPHQEFRYADRVENIAQTELARGFGYGNVLAMMGAGIDSQEWLYSGLPVSRHGPELDRGNGQIVKVGEPFSLSGHLCHYPADPALPIGQAARCKCVVVPSDGPGANS